MYKNRFYCLLFVFACAALGFASSTPALATTRTVTTTADTVDPSDGVLSLREAVTASGAGDTIVFSVTGTITLTSGQLVIDDDGVDVAIVGCLVRTVQQEREFRVEALQADLLPRRAVHRRDAGGRGDGDTA